jgi:hypothetical protein
VFLSACTAQDKGLLEQLDITVNAGVQKYKGNKVTNSSSFVFQKNQSTLEAKDATWSCDLTTQDLNGNSFEHTFVFKLTKGKAKSAGVAVSFTFDQWNPDNYVIMPAAAYNGNRFDVMKYAYPPLFTRDEYKVDRAITITDVPRLNKYEGKSRMDLNTGDLTTPALGVYFPDQQKGIWILTEQATELGNSVLSLKENAGRTQAEFTIAAPCVREKVYGMTRLSDSNETGVNWKAGDEATINCKVFVFEDIHSPADLNKQFLSIRKSIGTTNYVHQLPFSKAFEIMEEQQNTECWDEASGFYSLGGEGWNMKWQLGWVGGCMVTHPLSLAGKTFSKERALMNYQTIITQSQAKSGFYYSCGNGKEWCSDCFSQPFEDNLLLLRKNADALYYFYKYCSAQKYLNPTWQMPGEWKRPLRDLADAFVSLWQRHGQFGQFIDMESGEIKVGGTNSAAMAIGGLALAAQYENRPELLQTAKEAARYYYTHFIKQGISNGGPSEILQNNDSESAFATLESFMVLYEVTGEKEWLNHAEDAAALCATWTVSYDYRFPSTSLFGQLDMRTTGSVWASTQNKHGGPGICTLSGDCLFKLYRATGNQLYLELIQDIAHNIMQYISREDRPIRDLHNGWVNERVNLSDWEGKANVGNLFHGNTWAQVSAMLTTVEIPGIYVDLPKKDMIVFDHVEASLEGNKIKITNPTPFDASVKVFIDEDPSKSYGQGFVSQCPVVEVKAGASTYYTY